VTCNLHNRGIERIDSLSHLRNLRALDLSFNRIRRVENLSALGQLRELKLYGNRLTVVEGLEALGQLQVLSLEGNALERLGGLGALRNLRELRLGHNRLTSLRGLGRLPALELVSAPQNALTSLEGLEGLAGLRRLDLEGNELASLAGLGRLARLEELSLSGNPLGPGGLRGLERLAKSLDVLQVARCGLEGPLAKELPTAFPELTELFVGGNRLTALGGALRTRLPGLEILDLSANLVADPAMLQALEGMPLLADLRFEGNPACAVLGERYRAAVAEALPDLETLDDAPVEEGVFGAAEASGMAEFLTAKGITSLGVHEALAVGSRGVASRPSSARPGSARPGSARPGTPLGGRPGSSSSRAAVPGTVAAAAVAPPLLQQRGWSERTGLGGKLLSAREYEATSEAFAEEVADYRAAMRSVVADLRSGYLEPSAGEALAALRAAGGEPGAAATAALPRPPVAPALHGRIADIVGREARGGAAPAPSAAAALLPGGACAKVEEREPSRGAGGEGGRRSGRAPSPPRVLVVDGFEGQDKVTIQRLEDAELLARAGSTPVCDDAGVATGGLPPDAPGRKVPEARRRPGAGAGTGTGAGAGTGTEYRHFKLPPRASKGRGGSGPKHQPRLAGPKQPRAPLQPRHAGPGQRRGVAGERDGNGNN